MIESIEMSSAVSVLINEYAKKKFAYSLIKGMSPKTCII